VLQDVAVKLDLRTNSFDVNTGAGIKVLEGSRVFNFAWKLGNGEEEKFVNCNQFRYYEGRLSGFCKVTGQSLQLITRYDAALVKANYNVALDVGSKKDRWTRQAHLFLLQGDGLIRFSRRSFFKAVGGKERAVRKYISDEGLTLSKEEDVQKAVLFYNTLSGE
ncbi:MAG TPA: hypothetical protein VD816_03615, partial [Ohtaekwangia sp.]|nr:hypothetical protein [Ohtaekwangia sp.]